MGEESIAQKTHTRRQGTVEDGRKRRRRAGEKERVDMHTGEQAIRLEKKEEEEKKSQQENRSKRVRRGGRRLRLYLTSEMSQRGKHRESPQNNRSPVQKRQDIEQ